MKVANAKRSIKHLQTVIHVSLLTIDHTTNRDRTTFSLIILLNTFNYPQLFRDSVSPYKSIYVADNNDM